MSQVADQPSGSPQLSPNFSATLQRAYVYADEQAHRQVTAEHLLLALTEDPDCIAVLRRKTVDLDHLRNEIAGLVSRNTDRFAHGEASQPDYGADLQRVLAHAGGAAAGRRPIDGALALAALIADGRTPAAELIKLYGLTFEDAARGPRARPETAPEARPETRPNALPPLGTLRAAALDTTSALRKRAAALPEPDAGGDFAPLPLPLPRRRTAQAAPPPPIQPLRPRPVVVPPEAYPETQAPANANWPETYAEDPGYPPAQPPMAAPEPPMLEPEFEPQDYGQSPQRQFDAGPAEAEAPLPWPDLPFPPADQVAEPQQSQWQEPEQATYAAEPEPPAPPPRRARPAAEPAARPTQDSGATRRGRTGKTARRKHSRPILVENIPRRMQAGDAVLVEARIGRHDIETALVDLAHPGFPTSSTVPLAQTMTVRLRAEDGDIAIETNSPETQWIDGALGLIEDDFASWRWTLTPNAAGRAKLHFVISARSVDEDGLSGEVALPDQTVELRITSDLGRFLRRLAGRIVVIGLAFVAGGMAERFFGLFHRLLGGH